jgi:K+-transporting ATPase ATPase C chain
MIRRQLVTGLLMTGVLIVLLGLVYPLAMTAVAQVTMKDKANGSYVKVNGKDVGSSLLGQSFSDAKGNPIPKYFQPRPSATGGSPYNALASGGSNLGPSNPDLLKAVRENAIAYRSFNGLARTAQVPVDAVTASASGLDPDISVANARLQAPRVARVRGLPLATVLDLVRQHTTTRSLGFMGEDGVNVLELNLALDRVHS